MMDEFSIQKALSLGGFYSGKVDGSMGPASELAMVKLVRSRGVNPDGWNRDRLRVAAEQSILADLAFYPKTSKVDGLVGPNTQEAWRLWQAAQRKTVTPAKVEVILPPNKTVGPQWPTQVQIQTQSSSAFGERGKNLVMVPIPWKAYLAWDNNTVAKNLQLNKQVADSAERVMNTILKEIGYEKIVDLGLHLISGSYNLRKMRNGTAWSMHSWGIAIDFDDTRNQLSWGRDRARLGRPDAVPMWEIWESEGWVSLGRARNFDWMHVQAARL